MGGRYTQRKRVERKRDGDKKNDRVDLDKGLLQYNEGERRRQRERGRERQNKKER